MQILEVLPSISSTYGGPVRSTLANCRAVHKINPSVRFTLATTGQGLDSAWWDYVETQKPPGMRIAVFPAHGGHAFTFSPRLVTWLLGNVAFYDLVVVRTLFNPISTVAAWAARRRGVPYVVVPHGTLSPYTFRHRRTLLKRAYFRLIVRRTLASASAVRFTCYAERDQRPAWGDNNPIPVIPHPYEPRFVQTPRGDFRDRQILFLSRLDRVKGVHVILESMRELRDQISGAHLVLAGSGNPAYERHIRSEIRRLGLEEVTDLPGFVEAAAKARLLAESAIFVLPSQHESFGIAVVEAMDAGLPVVISRGVGIWRDVKAAGAGIVVETPTPQKFTLAISKLLTDEQLRRQMGERGRKLVAKAFDPLTMGRELLALYRCAAQKRKQI